MTRILAANPKSVEQAAAFLKEGGLVGMPTETVYGLAANACDGQAVAKIFEAKGRPQFNPLIVHVNSIEEAQEFAEMNGQEVQIAQSFWPGPLTMILKRKDNSGLSDLVSAGLQTVAVRVPAHKVARALIKACGFPIAAPSANKSGSLSPTSPAHVAQSLGDAVDVILADGACAVGLESTVIDCSGDAPLILRPGGLSAEDIAEVIGVEVLYDLGDHGGDVKSPGQLLKHYAPDTPVRLNAIDLEEGEALLSFGSVKFMGVKNGASASDLPRDMVCHLSKEGDLYEAASNLFAMMRELDKPQHKAIAVMNIPEQGIGIAINDRLKRAAKQ
ncbi:MAG: L-threonylcarbamoyladenylate synthase [Alphaproteobacteria bacterium]